MLVGVLWRPSVSGVRRRNSAVKDVENSFRVKLDYSLAGNWITVGDVYAALLDALRNNRSDAEIWPLFASAICLETEVDPKRIAESTVLLGRRRRGWGPYLIVGAGVIAALWEYWC